MSSRRVEVGDPVTQHKVEIVHVVELHPETNALVFVDLVEQRPVDEFGEAVACACRSTCHDTRTLGAWCQQRLVTMGHVGWCLMLMFGLFRIFNVCGFCDNVSLWLGC